MLLIAAAELLETQFYPTRSSSTNSREGSILAAVMKWIVPSVGKMVEVKRKHCKCVHVGCMYIYKMHY